MKKSLFLFLFLFAGLLFSFQFPSQKDCGETPEWNQEVIDFVNTKLKKKVGNGECWELAAQALNSFDAKWDGKYVFGKEVNYKTGCIYPGDIIQFEGVVVKYEKDGTKFMEYMTHHTAVIYEVKETGVFTLAHQNIGNWGKKVGLSPLDLKNITKGTFKIFRPEK